MARSTGRVTGTLVHNAMRCAAVIRNALLEVGIDVDSAIGSAADQVSSSKLHDHIAAQVNTSVLNISRLASVYVSQDLLIWSCVWENVY